MVEREAPSRTDCKGPEALGFLQLPRATSRFGEEINVRNDTTTLTQDWDQLLLFTSPPRFNCTPHLSLVIAVCHEANTHTRGI